MRNGSSIELRMMTGVTPAERAQLTELYRFAGWIGAAESGDFLERAVVGSFVAVGAFTAAGRLVGFGRALSDGVSDAYLQDIAVHPDFRKRGIGAEIVRFLTAELRRRGVDWIGLVGEPGTERFYEGLGFAAQRNFTLWKA